jgi:hypothetical protein
MTNKAVCLNLRKNGSKQFIHVTCLTMVGISVLPKGERKILARKQDLSSSLNSNLVQGDF